MMLNGCKGRENVPTLFFYAFFNHLLLEIYWTGMDLLFGSVHIFLWD